jgi:hypothetical protein
VNRHKLWRRILASTAFATASLVTFIPGVARASTLPLLGFYANGDNPVTNDGLVSGITPQIFSAYADADSWNDIGSDTSFFLDNVQSGQRLMISVPMCIGYGSGDDLEATHNHLATFGNLAAAIYAAGYRNTIYRIGWEANGNYQAGNVIGVQAPYGLTQEKAAGFCWATSAGGSTLYKQEYLAIRAKILANDPSSSGDFDFNINGGGPQGGLFQDGGTINDWDPGWAYVPDIGVDYFNNVYLQGSPPSSATSTWDNVVGGTACGSPTWGACSPVNYAALTGRYWSIDEWGQGYSSADPDDTTFMNIMYDFSDGLPVTNPNTNTVQTFAVPQQTVYFWGDCSELSTTGVDALPPTENGQTCGAYPTGYPSSLSAFGTDFAGQ